MKTLSMTTGLAGVGAQTTRMFSAETGDGGGLQFGKGLCVRMTDTNGVLNISAGTGAKTTGGIAGDMDTVNQS